MTIVLTYYTMQLKAWFIKCSITAVSLNLNKAKINLGRLNFAIIADRESSKLLNTVYSESQL